MEARSVERADGVKRTLDPVGRGIIYTKRLVEFPVALVGRYSFIKGTQDTAHA